MFAARRLCGSFVGGEGTVVKCDFVDLPLEVGDAVVPAADEPGCGILGGVQNGRADDLGLAVAIKVDGDLSTITNQRDMVPGFGPNLGLAGQGFVRAAAVVGGEKEPARGNLRSADAEVVAGCTVATLGAARDEVTGDRAKLSRQAVPWPRSDRSFSIQSIRFNAQHPQSRGQAIGALGARRRRVGAQPRRWCSASARWLSASVRWRSASTRSVFGSA